MSAGSYTEICHHSYSDASALTRRSSGSEISIWKRSSCAKGLVKGNSKNCVLPNLCGRIESVRRFNHGVCTGPMWISKNRRNTTRGGGSIMEQLQHQHRIAQHNCNTSARTGDKCARCAPASGTARAATAVASGSGGTSSPASSTPGGPANGDNKQVSHCSAKSTIMNKDGNA
jgi:hypothetical protein